MGRYRTALRRDASAALLLGVVLDACDNDGVPVGGCASWMRDRSTGWRLRLCRISGGVICAAGGADCVVVLVLVVAEAPPAATVAMVACRK